MALNVEIALVILSLLVHDMILANDGGTLFTAIRQAGGDGLGNGAHASIPIRRNTTLFKVCSNCLQYTIEVIQGPFFKETLTIVPLVHLPLAFKDRPSTSWGPRRWRFSAHAHPNY